MTVSVKSLTDTLIAESRTTSPDQAIKRLKDFLTRRKLDHLWLSIDSELQKRSVHSKLASKLIVARADDTANTDQVMDYYQVRTGDNTVSEDRLDPHLLGGVVVEGHDSRLDVTIKKQLQKLHQTLN